jgi:hypothetical protein
MFALFAAVFIGAAAIIWLAPKPRLIEPGVAH